MIRLRDSILIDAPPQRVWAWLSELPRHYREWHPAHRGCRYVRGNRLAAGAVLQIDEELHGKPHSFRLRADAVEPRRLLRFSGRAFRGAFRLHPVDRGTQFTAELEFGLALPFVGRLVDWLLRRMFRTQLSAIRTHMREEGRNLKRLLESASSV